MVTQNGVYQASSIKRPRRTRSQMAALRAALYDLVAQHQPVTVRQAFYLATTAGLVPKTEQAYDNDVGRLLALMRREGVLPWSWIADNTRWMRKPRTFTGGQAALQQTAALYRKMLWANQHAYVEVWMEKDALAGVLYPITEQWDVPLMIPKGYSSVTYLYEAAQAIAEQDKPAYVYYFGDHDPSGRDISRKVEADLRTFSGGADIHFTRVAVEPWQIAAWNLPTRPTKATDSRAKTFVGESVEVDAIPPDTLRQLVQDVIEQHVDPEALAVTQAAEASEREILHRLSQWYREVEAEEAGER